jgi:3-oxoacyl-[acyl-carrier protein] reductase
MSQQLALQPTGKAGTPQDIAHTVSFLVDPQTSFITGQVFFLDGGKSLGGSGA